MDKIFIPKDLLISRRIGKTRDLRNAYLESRKKVKKFKIELTEPELACLAAKCGGSIEGSNIELFRDIRANRAFEHGILVAANEGFKNGKKS